MQARYDLELAEAHLAKRIKREVKVLGQKSETVRM